MKKLICMLLAVLLLISMTACGAEKKAQKPVEAPDMQAVFSDMSPYLPADALAFDGEYVFNAYGVKPDDCKQQVVVSYYDGAVTAEIWMIEAVSKDALATIKQMAENRLNSMCEQFRSYDPKAYELAEDAELFTEGNCLVLIVSENAQQLLQCYRDAQ